MKPNTVQLNTDLTTKKLLVEKSEPKTETFDGYTAEFAGKAFEGYANIDFSLYDCSYGKLHMLLCFLPFIPDR